LKFFDMVHPDDVDPLKKMNAATGRNLVMFGEPVSAFFFAINYSSLKCQN